MIRRLVVSLGLPCVVLCYPASGTELKPATAQAFQQYIDKTDARMQSEVSDPKRFLWIDRLPDEQKAAVLARLHRGEVVVQSEITKEHELPVPVPGGLVHHWVATAFFPGVTAAQVQELSESYSRYGELYKPDVQSAKILRREGQHFDVYYRFYRHTIVSVVYNAEFDVDYFKLDDATYYSLARATRIAEVQNPGKPDEKEYPVGKDHGYLWRLNLYTRWVERDRGVYVQIEFLALSRTIPAIFAWLVNPYVRSVPREYLSHFLEATRKALPCVDDKKSARNAERFCELWN